MPDTIDREVTLALWKIHILHHATERPVYGLWLLDELSRHGYRPSPGTLYPILARMEHAGWLRAAPQDHARARRAYRLTARGRRALAGLRRRIAELHREIGTTAARRGAAS